MAAVENVASGDGPPPPPKGAAPSTELVVTFNASSAFVRALPKDAKAASQAEKLRAYAFYKQAKEGDCKGSRPGMMNFTLRAKWDAHHKLLGMSKGEAMQGYIDEIEAQKFKFDWTQYD